MLRKPGLGLILVACGFATAALADSTLDMRNVLEQKVRIYQESKDCKGMTGLFYTQGIDKVRKKAFTKTVEDYVCANLDRRIASIAFQSVEPSRQKQPSDFNGKHSVFTLEPQGAIVIDYGKGAKASDPKSLSFLYGAYDGQDYLITTKNADAK